MRNSVLIVSSLTFLIVLSLFSGVVTVVQVSGDSMQPDLQDGDVVVTTTLVDPEPGDVVVFEDDGDKVIHQIKAEVDKGENWEDSLKNVDPADCEEKEQSHCSADTAGYLTSGTNTEHLDQVVGYGIVEDEDVIGVCVTC